MKKTVLMILAVMLLGSGYQISEAQFIQVVVSLTGKIKDVATQEPVSVRIEAFDKNGNRVYYGRTKKENDGYYYVTGLKSGKEYTFVFTENKEYGKRKEKVEIPETEKFMEIERDFLIAKKSSNSATTGR